jgi:hypothetical protein
MRLLVRLAAAVGRYLASVDDVRARKGAILFASMLVASAVVAALTTHVLAGGGGSTALPACARPAVAIARPSRQFPERFPFPAGTVFTRLFRNAATRGMPTVAARIPLDLDEATRFFDAELPRSGFRIFLRQHSPGQSGAYYDVDGFSGRFEVEALPGCRGATSIAVSSRPTLLGRNLHSE